MLLFKTHSMEQKLCLTNNFLFSIPEFMAPPSYEEVVGVHYPNYPGQPITQPINAALAHSSNATITDSVVVTTVNETAPVSVIVASEPSSTSVTVTRS